MANKNKIIPVILCGGSGTRLWPISRENMPKQFLSLTGQESLLQMTALRATDIAGAEPEELVVVTLGAMKKDKSLDLPAEGDRAIEADGQGVLDAPAVLGHERIQQRQAPAEPVPSGLREEVIYFLPAPAPAAGLWTWPVAGSPRVASPVA